MLTKKTMLVCGILVAVAALAGNRWLGAQEEKGITQDLPAVLKVKPREPQAGDDEKRKLRIARYNAALSEAQTRFSPRSPAGGFSKPYQIGATDQAVVRLFEAELALAKTGDDREKACDNYLAAAKYLEVFVAKYVKAGTHDCTTADIDACRFMRLDAEIRLIDAKAGTK